jgi:hypothetical protein
MNNKNNKNIKKEKKTPPVRKDELAVKVGKTLLRRT